MNIYDKKANRDILQMRLRASAVIIAVTFWVSFFCGYNMAVDSIIYSIDKIFDELKLNDLHVIFESSSPSEIPNFQDIHEIQFHEKRFISKGYVPIYQSNSVSQTPDNTKKSLSVLVIYDNYTKDKSINKLHILEGEPFSIHDSHTNNSQVIIDRTMAKEYNLTIGDQIELHQFGHISELTVKGISLSPEFIFPSANPEMQITAKGSLGILFLPLHYITNTFDSPLYNSIIFTYRDNIDKELFEEKFYNKLSSSKLHAYIPRDESLDYKCLQGIINGAKGFAPVYFLLIGIVVLIVIYIHIRRMMEEKKREIGIVLALGASKKLIFKYFFKIIMAYVVVGIIIGVVSSFFLNVVFAKFFIEPLGLSNIHYKISVSILAKGVILCLIFCIMGIIISCVRLLSNLSPINALQPSTGTIKRYVAFDGASISALFSSISFKYGFRNLLRNRNLSLTTIISIMMSLAMVISFNITLSSTHHTYNNFYQRGEWDTIVDFQLPLNENEIKEMFINEKIDKFEGYYKSLGEITIQNNKSFGVVIGLPAICKMRPLKIVQGQLFTDNYANEAIINRNVWKDINVNIDDIVHIRAFSGARDVKIVGIVDEPTIAYEYVYIPIDTANDLFQNSNKYTGIWCQTEKNAEDQKQALLTHDLVAQVLSKMEVLTIIHEYIHDLRKSIKSFGITIMIITPFFLFTSLGLSLLERENDFMILRSIGFQFRRIFRILLVETFSMGIAGIVLSIPIGIFLGYLINLIDAKLYHTLELHCTFNDFVYVLICILLLPIVAFVFSARMMSLNIIKKLANRTT